MDTVSTQYLEIKYRQQGPGGLISNRHTHNDVEIIQILSGSGTALKSGKIYPMKTGAVYFINAIEPHFMNPENPAFYLRNKLVISAPFFRQCCDLLGLTPFTKTLFEGDPVSWPTSGIPDQIDDLCRRMHEEYSRLHACSDAFLTAYLLQILEKIYEGMDSNLSLLSLGGITDQILDFIGRTDLAEFSIGAMCDQLHVSKFYACHRFRDAVGLTIMDYIDQRKLSKAKTLLAENTLSIAEIADQLGYASPSSFSRAFSRLEGCTPKDYRRTRC